MHIHLACPRSQARFLWFWVARYFISPGEKKEDMKALCFTRPIQFPCCFSPCLCIVNSDFMSHSQPLIEIALPFWNCATFSCNVIYKCYIPPTLAGCLHKAITAWALSNGNRHTPNYMISEVGISNNLIGRNWLACLCLNLYSIWPRKKHDKVYEKFFQDAIKGNKMRHLRND